jgi:hypothetical protein
VPFNYDIVIELFEFGTEVFLRDYFIECTIHQNAFPKWTRKVLSRGCRMIVNA